ncbi:MAG: CoA pyrophosphatase [Planctomycetes bacterium]|nr:CoA pyrophosphatase [Planctomycetota bacterium]
MADLDALLRDRLAPIGDWQATTLRRAAVLVPLLAVDGVDGLLLVVRPDAARQHAGQIAFPGGMRDADESIVATATRECREETGVDPATLLGALTPRVSSSNILVHAVVGRLTAGAALRPCPREVVRTLWLPLAEAFDETRWHELPPPGGATGAQPATSPHFRHGADLVWGLTGRFLRDLAAALR